MRKKQFGKLLTISLSDECYGLVEKVANAYQMSMSAVIRGSIEHSIDQNNVWIAARPRPLRQTRRGRNTSISENGANP